MELFVRTFTIRSGGIVGKMVDLGGLVAPLQGYVTTVQSDHVDIELGSAQGIQTGTRLAIYKANDPTTRAGVLEVIKVIDAGTSRARVVTILKGVRPEFSDMVRLDTTTVAGIRHGYTAGTGPRTGHVTGVKGNEVALDLGSAAGIEKGTKLAFYKANDPNTEAGILEVIQVIDANNSRARIVYLLEGVRPAPSALVRTQ